MRSFGPREVVPTGILGSSGRTWRSYRAYRKMGYSAYNARRMVMSDVFMIEHSLRG